MSRKRIVTCMQKQTKKKELSNCLWKGKKIDHPYKMIQEGRFLNCAFSIMFSKPCFSSSIFLAPINWFWGYFLFFLSWSRSKSRVLTHWCHFPVWVWRCVMLWLYHCNSVSLSGIKEECVLWSRKLTDWLS